MLKHGRSRRGQALVEFALALPLFILVLAGILDFGRAVYAYNTLNNAAREGARVAIVDQNESRIRDVAEAHAVGFGITVTVAYHEPNPNPDPSTNPACTTVVIGCIAIVETAHAYVSATPVIGALVGEIDLHAQTEMPVERSFVSP